MSVIFSKPIIENKTDAAFLIIRIGIAFAFFWAGYGKAFNPSGFAMMLHNIVGFESEMALTLTILIGIFELTSGTFVLVGFLTRPAAVFQAIIAIGAMTMFGFDFTAGPAIWKDPTILGIALSLLIFGSGKFGVDTILSRKFNSKK